jgi:hypothetical protein
MKQKTESWQAYRRTTKNKGKTQKPRKFCQDGRNWIVENAVFLNTQAPSGEAKDKVHIKVLCCETLPAKEGRIC